VTNLKKSGFPGFQVLVNRSEGRPQHKVVLLNILYIVARVRPLEKGVSRSSHGGQ
jgi:hypothetical protein